MYICSANARIAQLVEHDLAKVGVAGSSPVSRSFLLVVAQVVELVDTLDLKSSEHCARAGSSPAPGSHPLHQTCLGKSVQTIKTFLLPLRYHLSFFKNTIFPKLNHLLLYGRLKRLLYIFLMLRQGFLGQV